MAHKQPYIIFPNLWGKRFIIFSIILIIVTGICVYFFDNTKMEDPLDPATFNPVIRNQKEQKMLDSIRSAQADSTREISPNGS